MTESELEEILKQFRKAETENISQFEEIQRKLDILNSKFRSIGPTVLVELRDRTNDPITLNFADIILIEPHGSLCRITIHGSEKDSQIIIPDSYYDVSNKVAVAIKNAR